MDELAYLVGPTTFSRIPFSIGCHSPTDNNRFRGSLDCVLNAWQVEACYAKSAERGKKRGKEKERERERERQTRRLCLRHPASRQERISFLYPSPLFFCHGNSKCCIYRENGACDLSRPVDFREERQLFERKVKIPSPRIPSHCTFQSQHFSITEIKKHFSNVTDETRNTTRSDRLRDTGGS